jgi:O-antigen/teichoic acid export membrane protein
MAQEESKELVGTKAALLSFFDNIFGLAVGILFNMVLSRKLGLETYGQYSIIFSIFTVFTFFIIPGFSFALTHSVAASSEHRSIFLFAVRAGIIAEAIICTFYFFIAKFICQFLKIESLYGMILVMGVGIIPAGLVAIVSAYFRGRFDFIKNFLLSSCSHVARFFIIIGVLFSSFRLNSIIVVFVFFQLLIFIFSLYLVKIRKTESQKFEKKILLDSIPFSIIGFIAIFMYQVDIMCIKYFLNDYSYVSYYTSATRILEMVSTFLLIPTTALFPVLSKLIQLKDYNQATIVLERYIRYHFLLAAPLCLWIALNSATIITEIFSQEFIFGAPILALYCVFWLFISTFQVLNTTMLAQGKVLVIAIFQLAAAIFNLFLNVLLVPTLGIIGAAIATGFSFLFSSAIIFLYAYHNDYLPSKKFHWVQPLMVKKIALIILLLFLINKYVLIFPQNFLNLCLKTIIIFSLYFFLLLSLKIFNSEDALIYRAVIIKIKDSGSIIFRKLFV